MFVCSCFGHSDNIPTDRKPIPGIGGSNDGQGRLWSLAHVAFFSSPPDRIDEDVCAIIVHPDRGDMRGSIRHDGCQVSKGWFLKEVKGVLRNRFNHKFLLSLLPVCHEWDAGLVRRAGEEQGD